jgi:hypothetical protein
MRWPNFSILKQSEYHTGPFHSFRGLFHKGNTTSAAPRQAIRYFALSKTVAKANQLASAVQTVLLATITHNKGNLGLKS